MPHDQTHQYGICGVTDAKSKVSRITSMVEKPPRGTAPSNLHITGRYILQPEIFDILSSQESGSGNEIQLTDAMIKLAAMDNQAFHAVRFDGAIYDCGTKVGFLVANVAYALARDDLAPGFKAAIKKLLLNSSRIRSEMPRLPSRGRRIRSRRPWKAIRSAFTKSLAGTLPERVQTAHRRNFVTPNRLTSIRANFAVRAPIQMHRRSGACC